jgi:hypothetical protein
MRKSSATAIDRRRPTLGQSHPVDDYDVWANIDDIASGGNDRLEDRFCSTWARPWSQIAAGESKSRSLGVDTCRDPHSWSRWRDNRLIKATGSARREIDVDAEAHEQGGRCHRGRQAAKYTAARQRFARRGAGEKAKHLGQAVLHDSALSGEKLRGV